MIKFDIPHAFTIVSGWIAPTWCIHCGLVIPMLAALRKPRKVLHGFDLEGAGAGAALICRECGQACHAECRVFVPNYCGLTVKLVETWRKTVQDVYRQQQLKRLPSPPPMIGSAGEAPVGIEKYLIHRVLGRGHFGKVVLAEVKESGRCYAIKILKKHSIISNDEMDMLRIEHRVSSMILDFPFLLGHCGVFHDESRIYMCMEYLWGGDLMHRIQACGLFDTSTARFYAAQVLLALEWLHMHGIMYRDLKLDNLMIDGDGYIRLVDYGLCKDRMHPVNPDEPATTRTFCGTPEFIAPEVLEIL